MAKTRLEKLIEQHSRNDQFLVEALLIEISDQLNVAMEQQGVTQSELAERLGVSKSYVSRLLHGTPNLTLRTLVRLSNALNRRVQLDLADFAAAQGSAHVAALPGRVQMHGD